MTIIAIKSVGPLTAYFAPPETVAQTLGFLSTLIGIGMWGFAFFWLLLAIWFTLTYARKSTLDFALSWWAFIFPLGAFAVATGVLFTATALAFFLWVGLAALLGYAALWLVVFLYTLKGAWNGTLFIPHN